eukprot:gene18705-6119_t
MVLEQERMDRISMCTSIVRRRQSAEERSASCDMITLWDLTGGLVHEKCTVHVIPKSAKVELQWECGTTAKMWRAPVQLTLGLQVDDDESSAAESACHVDPAEDDVEDVDETAVLLLDDVRLPTEDTTTAHASLDGSILSLQQLVSRTATGIWVILACHGGYFAGGVFIAGDLVAHKTHK